MFCIDCHYGYSLLGEAPPKINRNAFYELICESIYYPGCCLMRSVDRSVCPQYVIVHKRNIYEIASISFDKDEAFS